MMIRWMDIEIYLLILSIITSEFCSALELLSRHHKLQVTNVYRGYWKRCWSLLTGFESLLIIAEVLLCRLRLSVTTKTKKKTFCRLCWSKHTVAKVSSLNSMKISWQISEMKNQSLRTCVNGINLTQLAVEQQSYISPKVNTNNNNQYSLYFYSEWS